MSYPSNSRLGRKRAGVYHEILKLNTVGELIGSEHERLVIDRILMEPLFPIFEQGPTLLDFEARALRARREIGLANLYPQLAQPFYRQFDAVIVSIKAARDVEDEVIGL